MSLSWSQHQTHVSLPSDIGDCYKVHSFLFYISLLSISTRVKVTSSVAFFFLFWTAAMDNILTTYNLFRRGITIMDWCSACKVDGWIIYFSTITLLMIYGTWCSACLGFVWVMLQRVIGLLEDRKEDSVNKKDLTWKDIPLHIMWWIWIERNE